MFNSISKICAYVLLFPVVIVGLHVCIFNLLELKSNDIHTFKVSNYENEIEKFKESLKQISAEIEMLKQKRSRLTVRNKGSNHPQFINDSTFRLYSLPDANLDKWIPTEKYEITRRRIYSNTKELWYYLNHKLTQGLKQKLSLEQTKVILKDVAARKRSLLSDQEKRTALDGFEPWRRREAVIMSDLVQRGLHKLQHPRNCTIAEKILCKHYDCGFGSDIHYLAFCLMIANAFGRTLLVRDSNWLYKNDKKGWTDIFQQVSKNCSEAYKTKYMKIKNIHFYKNLTKSRSFRIPKDLAPRIIRFSGDPKAWWIGQFVKFIMRLKRPGELKAAIREMNFTSPIVGVHIRHSDKVEKEYTELFSINDYMVHVDDYYEKLRLTRTIGQRRVYLATDDVSVLEEAIRKYPQYIFYGNTNRVQRATKQSTRFSPQGAIDILFDLHVLSSCDFVVCTFSSNIGRLAYELMHARGVDATNRFISLDSKYFFTTRKK